MGRGSHWLRPSIFSSAQCGKLLDTVQAHKEAVERRIKNLKDDDAGVIEKRLLAA